MEKLVFWIILILMLIVIVPTAGMFILETVCFFFDLITGSNEAFHWWFS